jgi:hypothetical protein
MDATLAQRWVSAYQSSREKIPYTLNDSMKALILEPVIERSENGMKTSQDRKLTEVHKHGDHTSTVKSVITSTSGTKGLTDIIIFWVSEYYTYYVS